MAVDHLKGKRTGRPRGSRTTPHWVRALRWAERHLGNPDVVPPSALAGRLVALGRDQPDKFLACLALRDAQTKPPATPTGTSPDGRTATLAGDRPRRVKTLLIPLEHLVKQLTGQRPIPAVGNLPHDFQISGMAVKSVAAGWGGPPNRMLRLTIVSATFPEVPPGAEVPELVPQFCTCR